MTKAKVKFPQDAGEMSASDGTTYAPDENGESVIASEHIAELASFGVVVLEIIPVEDEPEAKTDEQLNIERLEAIAKGTQVQIAALLPDLSDEDLELLEQIEHEHSARKGVLGDIDAEMQARVDKAEAAKAATDAAASTDTDKKD